MAGSGYLLGLDIGSSFVKASLLEAESGRPVATASAPEREMPIDAPRPGWAEQDPELWWKQVTAVSRKVMRDAAIGKRDVAAIGLTYQMHGLVAVDRQGRVLRPSIIWCDSRAAAIGRKAFEEIGTQICLKSFLNSPGNFTASKLRWVREHEPELYDRIHKILLPGDYIAWRMTGRFSTTTSGLSEAILWDYAGQTRANLLLDHYGISPELIPEADDSFAVQGTLAAEAADEMGLAGGVPLAYRAGDQPNNAFSLRVFEPGEVAATAGTSGVIYGVTDNALYDERSRVNTFVHVNHRPERPRYGVLLCVNGCGILNSWLRRHLGAGNELTYEEMNGLAVGAPAGSDGLLFLPFGNGAERILEDLDIGAQLRNLHYNRHTTSHLLRAAQEGVVFALRYGLEIMRGAGMNPRTVRAGHANLFLSPLFREAFVQTTGLSLELYETDGAQGAARGAGVGAGLYGGVGEAFTGLRRIETVDPDPKKAGLYEKAWGEWLRTLQKEVEQFKENQSTR